MHIGRGRGHGLRASRWRGCAENVGKCGISLIVRRVAVSSTLVVVIIGHYVVLFTSLGGRKSLG